MPSRTRAALTAVLLAAAALGPLAPVAGARVSVGLGQQTPEFFTNPLWQVLHAPNVRYIAPWDALSDPLQRDRLDAWMAAADAAHAQVMIGFQHSLRSAALAKRLPTRGQYDRAFQAFRKRYPRVRDWVPWNETNHPASLTGKRPDMAAAYFDIASRRCNGCNVVAGDVLDAANMESWTRKFLHYVKTKPRIWGLHNYHDANSLVSTGVRRLLRLVRGQIWFTETGGVVQMRVRVDGREQRRNYGLTHAARSTRHVLELARLSPRVTRIYLYHWRAPSRFTTWDSALTDARQRARPAYRTLKAWLFTARRRGVAR